MLECLNIIYKEGKFEIIFHMKFFFNTNNVIKYIDLQFNSQHLIK